MLLLPDCIWEECSDSLVLGSDLLCISSLAHVPELLSYQESNFVLLCTSSWSERLKLSDVDIPILWCCSGWDITAKVNCND